ncbi:MAG: glycosyltransferase family 4 protein [Alcaligenaceae bacterium]|nr:glycosyltransferase family 4 protein [Alcaligenaceae bacterium]
MRILQLNLERGWRGGERQTLLTMQGLRTAGHEAFLLARRGGALGRAAQAEGFTVFDCDGAPGMAAALLGRAHHMDILHAQTAQAMSVLALLRPMLRGRIVFTRRTAFAPKGRPGRSRWKWSRADARIAISQAAAAAFRSLDLDVRVIPSAVMAVPPDPQRVEALRTQFGLHGGTVIGTAAALSPEKDPETLIRAVARLRAHSPDIVFLHCGADGAAGPAARALVDELGLAGMVRFAGFQEHIQDLYALMDIYVSSSLFEALGTSVLDACLLGVPVVATRVGGHLESLADGRGLLCEAGDDQVMAAHMQRLIEHPDEAADMAGRAQAYARVEYDPGTMVDRYLDLYRTLCPTAQGAPS